MDNVYYYIKILKFFTYLCRTKQLRFNRQPTNWEIFLSPKKGTHLHVLEWMNYVNHQENYWYIDQKKTNLQEKIRVVIKQENMLDICKNQIYVNNQIKDKRCKPGKTER